MVINRGKLLEKNKDLHLMINFSVNKKRCSGYCFEACGEVIQMIML